MSETKEPKPRDPGQKVRKGERKWLLRTFVGRDAQGRRHYRSETFLGSSKDADAKLRRMLEGKSAHDARVFLNDYLDTWLAGQLEISKRTHSDYTALLKAYVRPTLGLFRLSDIRSADVKKLYRSLLLGTHPRWKEEEAREQKRGIRRTDEQRKLSARTVRYVHVVLSKALKEAECLEGNPAGKVKLPKLKKTKPRFLTAAEARTFLDAASGDRLYALFAVAIDSGCRPSELLALRWMDVNTETGLIAIQRGLTWNRKGGGYTIGPLKTASSYGCIVLNKTTLQALNKHRIAQHQERLKLGADYANQDLVFCTTIGTPLQPRNVIGRHLKPILSKAGLPDNVRWYDLRHTMASMLLARGTNPKIVSERCRHGSVAFTLDVYSHSIPSMQQDAAADLERALYG